MRAADHQSAAAAAPSGAKNGEVTHAEILRVDDVHSTALAGRLNAPQTIPMSRFAVAAPSTVASASCGALIRLTTRRQPKGPGRGCANTGAAMTRHRITPANRIGDIDDADTRSVYPMRIAQRA